MPFAGIAFLWFIGVFRNRVGPLEDQFFATVFFGSGMLFVASLFASAAFLGVLVEGEVHNSFSDKKAAIDHYMQALPLLRASGDRAGEAKTLSNLGVAYTGTGEKRKALELFEDAMRILRPLQDRPTLATVASNIGVTYDNLGDYQLSLESHQYALTR